MKAMGINATGTIVVKKGTTRSIVFHDDCLEAFKTLVGAEFDNELMVYGPNFGEFDCAKCIH